MAWRMDKSVVRGEIDNRRRNVVAGRVWLVGRQDPVELRLEGNCSGDLAGRLFLFTNPRPESGDAVMLAARQEGRAGEMTASRKVRDIPRAELERLMAGGERIVGSNYPLANALHLEWFSRANGRVVIESTAYHMEVGEPAWTYSPEERQQVEHVDDAEAMYLGEFAELLEPEGGGDYDTPMDEFQWERLMRESDARAEKFSALFEKYADDPDRDRIIAREMGWSWVEEILDAEERGEFEQIEEEVLSEGVPELAPNPTTEGVDWVRNDHGHVEHPLTLKVHRLGLDMWRKCREKGHMEDGGDKDVQEMVFQTQITAAKLAGALNHLAYEEEPDGGFVVAALKRAVSYLHRAISASHNIAARNVLPVAVTGEYQRKLFEVRQEILALMQKYRQRI